MSPTRHKIRHLLRSLPRILPHPGQMDLGSVQEPLEPGAEVVLGLTVALDLEAVLVLLLGVPAEA